MWKTFGGRCIFQASNGAKVHQNLLYRWLTLGSELYQTMIHRYHPEKPALSYVDKLTVAIRAAPGASCLLGLGGAGVAHALAPYLGTIPLFAVEHDSVIIDLAEHYFMTSRLNNMHIIHQDAMHFVKTCQHQYQHLLVDLYDAHAFPQHCNNMDFFTCCFELLLPGGILAINLANLDWQLPTFELVKTVFGNRTVSFPVNDATNLVVLAYKGPSINPLLELLKNTPYLRQLHWHAGWGCIADTNGV